MIWLVIVIVLLLLLCIPIGVSAQYNDSGFRASLKLGFIRVPLYPAKAPAKEKPRKAEKTNSTQLKKATGKEGQNSSKSLTDFLPVLRLIFDFLVDFRKKLRVNLLELHVVLAGGDPCDTAINYGRTQIAAGTLIPLLDRFLIIKHKDIHIGCDFVAPQSTYAGKIELSITVAFILQLLGFHGVRFLLNYLKIYNKRKGGARA